MDRGFFDEARQKLDKLPENVTIVHILGNPDESWHGEKGHVAKEAIEKYAGDILKDAHVYVCGPPGTMNKVITALHELNIDDKRLHHERFTL